MNQAIGIDFDTIIDRKEPVCTHYRSGGKLVPLPCNCGEPDEKWCELHGFFTTQVVCYILRGTTVLTTGKGATKAQALNEARRNHRMGRSFRAVFGK